MKKQLLSLLLLPALLVSLVLPVHAADTDALLLKMNSILDLVEQVALNYDPAVINDDLRQSLSEQITADPSQFDRLMDEVLSGLDDYSMYLPAGTYETAFGGSDDYVGIGITMTQEDDFVYVKAIEPAGPAAQTGLQIGDILTSVDGVPLNTTDLTEIANRVRGEAGTTVRIGIRRGRLDMTFTMTRAAITYPAISGYAPAEGVYYIDLESFSGDTLEDEFRYYLLETTRLQSKVLILDLRGNPGGDLSIVTDMLGRLIPDKTPYFTIEGRGEGNDYSYNARGRGPRLNQIFLLTDAASASAAEVMTGTLCDLGYAESVGETTYGKARGQQHFLYPDGSAAVITTIRLVMPSGEDYEGVGLKPDHAVADRTVRHPAAFVRKLDFKYMGQGDTSWKLGMLQDALRVMNYLDESCTETAFGPETLAALNRFRADCGLPPKTYLNAESVNRINASLDALRTRKVPVDAQLKAALELARPYLRQPLQYASDKYGQFENIQ